MTETPYKHFKTKLTDEKVLIVGLDCGNKTVNVLSGEALKELKSIVGRVYADDSVKGAVLVSLKTGANFIAGADLRELAVITDKEAGRKFLTDVHELFRQIEESPKPFVAAIHGGCFGGGLELALACRFRVASDHPQTVFKFPEVMLGISPGAGGTRRIMKVVDLPLALEMVTGGKSVYAHSAFKTGLIDDLTSCVDAPSRNIDTVCEEPLVKTAVQKILNPAKAKRRKLSLNRILGWPLIRFFTFRRAKRLIKRRVKNHYPAPLKALEVMKNVLGKTVKDCLDAELPVVLDLIVTPLAKNLINVFFWEEKARRQSIETKPLLVPVNIKEAKVGILGAGKMGAQIANLFSEKGASVVLKDVKPEFLCRGLDEIRKTQAKNLGRKIIGRPEFERRLMRIYPTLNWENFGAVSVVIEAASENIEIKRKILEEFESAAPPKAVFATNTSSYSVKSIALNAKIKERCVGMHFFNPVSKMKLVEIVRADFSADFAVSETLNLAKALGLVPVVISDGPGFLVNRIITRYLTEAVLLLGDGVRIEAIDGAAKEFGMAIDSGRPMGPLELIDLVGIKTAVEVFESMKILGERVQSHSLIGAMAPPKEPPLAFWRNGRVNKAVYRKLAQIGGRNSRPVSKGEILNRLILPMADEALRCLKDGIVGQAWEIDLAMLYGVGFPAFRGGLLKWLLSRGVSRSLDDLEELTFKYGIRFQPCDFWMEVERNPKILY